jgi:hypothetical protein
MSRGLGALTLDLIVKAGGFIEGWDKSEREMKKRTKQMRKEMKELGDSFQKWGAIAVTAAATATAALITHTVKASKEIANLAQQSNAGFEEFQKYAAGAKHVGVETNQLAKIFEDTNKSVGQFLSTGGGKLQNFFENIAPKVGVTADQFRNLSGPDALQLYVNTLQKANLTSNQMIFHMENMARGSSGLVPLLKDGGQGFKLFADEAERAGSLLDDKVVPATDKIRAAMTIAENSAIGFKNQIAEGILPTFADLSVAFSGISSDGIIASSTIDIITGSMKGLSLAAVGTVAAIDLTRKVMAGLVVGLQSKAGMQIAIEDIGQTMDAWGGLLNSIRNAGEGMEGAIDERVTAIAEMFKNLREASSEGIGGFDPDSKLQEDMDKRLEIIRQASMTEMELLTQRRNQEFNFLIEQQDQNRITEEEYRSLELASVERFEKSKTDIQKKEADARRAALSGALGTISTLMNSESRKLFEIGKAGAIANSIISMHQGIMEAWKLGPILGPILAPIVGLAGLANIQAIRKTKFGGGTAGVSNTQAINGAATPAVPPGRQSEQQQQRIIIEGVNPDSLFSGRQVVELFNQAVADGARPIFA